MYVKLFNQILDSSLADNRRLRHFFTDLLLCSDADGNVIMTPRAIANRIRADLAEVEWGLKELQNPDAESLTQEHNGRRIVPLEGHGYGWKIVNFQLYRDFKTARQMREATAERVRKHRERKKAMKRGEPLPGEAAYVIAERAGAAEAQLDRMAADSLPAVRDNGGLSELQEQMLAEARAAGDRATVERLEGLRAAKAG